MINLAKWCVESEETFAKHKLRRMAVNAATQTQAVNAIAKAIPDYYTDPQRVASLLKKLGVASRTIIWSLIEQLRVSLMPLFHGLHRCFAVQC